MVSDWINGCVCADGYREDVDGGCVDIDECAEELDDCNGYATCQNFSGGFDCRCPGAPWPGMAEDGHGGCVCPGGFMEKEAAVCVDVNECALLTDECVAPATCSNTTGGYDCLCPAGSGMVPDGDNGCACPTGFLLDPFGVCQDIDECAQETDNCVEPATCNNVPGGFVCACPEGSGMVSDGHGGCVCPPGLELDETDVCVDIDECAVGTDNCVEPAECVNVPGSFNCECPEGYGYVSDGDGGCVCPDGFIDNGEVCADVDECLDQTDNCVAPAECRNFDGGFACDCPAGGYIPDGSGGCTCPNGFTDTGSACVDIDECSEGTDTCTPPATCVNYEGGFGCECPSGFYWDGLSCYDIDECGWGWVDCGLQACINTPGGYYCE